MKNDELLHKWINKTISAEELEVFKLRPEYGSLTELYKNTEGLAAPDFDMDSMLEGILAAPKNISQPSEPIQRSLRPMRWLPYGIAASMLLVASYFFLMQPVEQMINYELAMGQSMEGTLPDRSMFTLSGDSKLYYDKESWASERKLFLEGEASFKVTKGEKFSVETPTGTVAVLGTEFTVESRNEELKVACSEGRVQVKPKGFASIAEILIANESLEVAEDGSMKIIKQELTKLRQVSLEQVVQAIQYTYKIQLSAGTLSLEEKITCNFAHDNIDKALKTSLSPVGINYRQEGNQYILFK